MDISRSADSSSAHLTGFLGQRQTPENPKQAAEQFEQVLVRQFVETMTKDLFDNPISDKNSGAVRSQGRLQSEALTDTLTRKLVEDDAFGLSKLLLDQWQQ